MNPSPKPLLKTPPKSAPKPVIKPPKLIALPVKAAPKPVIKPVTKAGPKKVIKPIKKIVVSKSGSTTSLSDRLIKLLPIGDINYQPDNDPIVNVPIYFWSQTPTNFTAVVPILDVLVYVNLTPTFTWSFADGGFEISKLPGAAYPVGGVTHTYKAAGDYQINLKITWNGSWSVNGVSTPINGNALTQSISTKLTVVGARTRFNQ